jgi:predicted ATPase
MPCWLKARESWRSSGILNGLGWLLSRAYQAKEASTLRKKTKPAPGPYLVHMELLRDRVPSFDRFPYCLAAVRNLERLPFHPKVTFLVGENGTGKSTLLEALALSVGLNPEGGSRNFNFATRASHANLDECLRVAKTVSLARDSYFLRAESFYNVATEIERLDEGSGQLLRAYGGRSLHEQSHGESFFALFRNRFRVPGLYLMDEPEAALSPKRQLGFLAVLHDYCKKGAQFVIATHSPIIMAYPNANIYVLGEEGIREVAYQETEHYLVTRGFLANPQRTLKELLGEDEADGNRLPLLPD